MHTFYNSWWRRTVLLEEHFALSWGSVEMYSCGHLKSTVKIYFSFPPKTYNDHLYSDKYITVETEAKIMMRISWEDHTFIGT